MNTVSEIEGYYKKREQRLLKKLHQQEIALNAANQKLAQLIKNQKAQLDETTEQRAAHDQKFKEELYKDPLTGAYNRRYYEEVIRKSIGPAGIALMDVDDFKICNDSYGHHAGDMVLKSALMFRFALKAVLFWRKVLATCFIRLSRFVSALF